MNEDKSPKTIKIIKVRTIIGFLNELKTSVSESSHPKEFTQHIDNALAIASKIETSQARKGNIA